MSNALMTKEVNFMVNGEEVKLTGATVKNYLTSGNGDITEQELVMFINLCKYQHLNPFLNEAYIVKFGSQPAQIIVSKEAYMKRAEVQKEFDGLKAGIVVLRDGKVIDEEGALALPNDEIIGGWCEVYRKDRTHPYKTRVSMKEFGKGRATWKDMPANMIRKVAIVNALREAFPTALGGMYTEEEKDVVIEETPDDKAKREANSKPLEIKREMKREAVDVDPEPVNDPEPIEDDPTLDGTPFGNGPGF